MKQPNPHITRSGVVFAYGDSRRDLTYGLSVALTDDVPVVIREAEDRLQSAIATETEAHAAIGSALRKIDAAKAADAHARGAALADGKPAPKQRDLGDLHTLHANATADAAAAAEAITITRQRLDTAIATAVANGSVNKAVKVISDKADAAIAEARVKLEEAKLARDRGANLRGLSRLLDALPNAQHSGGGAPTSAPDEWRIGLNGIGNDLDILTDSVALSVLADRPDLQRQHRPGTKSESAF